MINYYKAIYKKKIRVCLTINNLDASNEVLENSTCKIR